MMRAMMRAKVHGATVTQVNLNYVGSLTLDPVIMESLDLLVNEKVHVLNMNNGARLETYLIAGERGSGVVGLNGAAARLAHPGDKVLVVAYAWMTDQEARSHKARVAIVDENNRIEEIREDQEATVFRKS